MRWIITYEREDGTLGQLWAEDWHKIMRTLYESTIHLDTPLLEYKCAVAY